MHYQPFWHKLNQENQLLLKVTIYKIKIINIGKNDFS